MPTSSLFSEACQSLGSGKTETRPLHSPPIAGMLDTHSNTSPAEGEARTWEVSLTLSREAMLSEHTTVQTTAFLLSARPDALPCPCSESGKREASPLGGPPRSLKVRCTFHSSPSLPREKLGVQSFLPNELVGGLWCEFRDFPIGFIAAGFPLFGVQEPLNWFLDFPLKEAVCVLMNKGYFGEEGSEAAYSTILLTLL